MRTICLAIALAACGGGGSGGGDDSPDASTSDGSMGGMTLSDQYPGDVGLGGASEVVWFEDFEEGSLAAVVARYNQAQGQARMQLVTDAPKGSALALTAGGSVSAVDLYKQLPDHDNVFVRWYVKYDANIPWHHSGMWFGGYNPGMPYPSPMAGTKPVGDDRFSISIEPVWDVPSASARFDFYNYWMNMHSWMQTPTNDGTSYYGNSLAHENAFKIDETQWVCLEIHVRLNPGASSASGAVLEVWKNDALVRRFDDGGPMGWWVRDKFCPADTNASECTQYPAPANEILNLQLRNTTSYAVNAFWPQNYITDPAMGTLRFDQMVVATTRVGCMR
jgi:hypothetical protein